MEHPVQVGTGHYLASKYVDRGRWFSYWHQFEEVVSLGPESVLEIGVGVGIFRELIVKSGIHIESVDIDPALAPDHLASVTKLPFDCMQFDVVACFQMLEHIKYSEFPLAMREMARASKRHLVVSLPDSQAVYTFMLQMPILGRRVFHLPRFWSGAALHQYDGEHYWEIGKKDYPLSRITGDLGKLGLRIVKNFRVAENPYHRFFVLEKSMASLNADR